MSGGEAEHDTRRRRSLLLFLPHRPPAFRRRRLTFLVLYGGVVLALTVPAVPAVWGIHPLILGVPTSFAWVILALTAIFAGLVWLYRREGE